MMLMIIVDFGGVGDYVGLYRILMGCLCLYLYLGLLLLLLLGRREM